MTSDVEHSAIVKRNRTKKRYRGSVLEAANDIIEFVQRPELAANPSYRDWSRLKLIPEAKVAGANGVTGWLSDLLSFYAVLANKAADLKVSVYFAAEYLGSFTGGKNIGKRNMKWLLNEHDVHAFHVCL